MSAPARPRPHRRAAAQLLLGLVPVLVVGAVLLVVLAVRLSAAQAPLAAATETAKAAVVATGRPPEGRGVAVRFDDPAGGTRTGVLVLRQPPGDVPAGTELTVAYDPSSPADDTAVYADGDAAHAEVRDLVFGLVVVALVVLVVAVLTGWRVLSRRRLRGGPATEVTASRVVVRQGLLVRSWLELVTPAGLRWLPVHWAPELSALAPDSPVEVRGDPGRDRLVLPVVAGTEIWPSGRLRRPTPRGDRTVAVPDADAPDPGNRWGRQVRSDVVLAFAAPVLGVLWAFVDESGTAGIIVATALAAVVLFWLPQFLGSDPDPPPRD